jgi:hypothetical protein
MRAEAPAERARRGLRLRGIHASTIVLCEIRRREKRALRMREAIRARSSLDACVSWVAIKVVELKLPVHPP